MSDSLEKWTPIGSLKPFMKNLYIQCIVLQIVDELKITKDGHEIYSFLVADSTGSIELLLWDEVGRCVQPGDILRLSSAYVTLYKDMLRLYVSKFGQVKRIAEYNMIFSESPNISNIKWIPDPNNPQQMIPMTKLAPPSASSFAIL